MKLLTMPTILSCINVLATLAIITLITAAMYYGDFSVVAHTNATDCT